MAVLEVTCNNQKLKWKEEPAQLFSGNIKIDGITFSFCPLWDGFIKTAVFYKDGEENNAFYLVLDENNTCFIPPEVTGTQGLIYVGVFGVKDECRRTTEPIAFYLDKGVITEGTPSEPTPDVFTQLLTLCNNAVTTAKSVEERANSGEFKGEKGNKGDTGEKGADGQDGYTPIKGVDYFTDEDIEEIKEPIEEDLMKLIPVVDTEFDFGSNNPIANTTVSLKFESLDSITGMHTTQLYGLSNRVTNVEKSVGDIETALDSIIAIQETLIGGGNV